MPRLDPNIPAVYPNKIKYPRLCFTDHKGEIEYDAWKMDMKLFIEEYSGNFVTGNAQVKAYFKCTGGEAKTIILQHMDPDFAGIFDSAADVLKALDQRFFDHNRVQAAKAKYHHLTMGSMTYNEFRIKFTSYASTGKIARSRWFEDVCEKVSPSLKHDLRIEKYKMNNDYAILDEFLAVADRESRNIAAEERLNRQATPVFPKPLGETHKDRIVGILKKDTWRRDTALPRPAEGASALPLLTPPATAIPAGSACRHCHKTDHWVKDCPELRKTREMDRKIAEIEGEGMDSDDLSENS